MNCPCREQHWKNLKAMSHQTEICQFCGGEIVFRVIRGVVTPIHQGNSNCIGRSLYRNDQEGIPHFTKCPKCGGAVIFLRSNGGSVWLESLGWPWPKHPCFEYDAATRSKNPILFNQTDALKTGKLMYGRFLGRLSSDEGIVILVASNREDLRRRPSKYYSGLQWELFCTMEEAEKLKRKFKSCLVLVNSESRRLTMIDGAEFAIAQHTPRYSGHRQE